MARTIVPKGALYPVKQELKYRNNISGTRRRDQSLLVRAPFTQTRHRFTVGTASIIVNRSSMFLAPLINVSSNHPGYRGTDPYHRFKEARWRALDTKGWSRWAGVACGLALHFATKQAFRAASTSDGASLAPWRHKESELAEEAQIFLHQHARPSASPMNHAEAQLAGALRVLLPVGAVLDDTNQVLWATAELSSRLSIQVIVVHCREWDFAKGIRYFLETREEANAIVAHSVDWLTNINILVSGVVRDVERGSVGKGIGETANEYNIQSIVLGVRPKRRILGTSLGSTINQVEHVADCPILIIRHNRRNL